MTNWHQVATLADLKVRKKKYVDVEGTPVALFYINDRVYALHDTCMHEQRQLSKGAVLFGKIVCPGHQWKFDPETGQPDDQDGCQPTYPVRIEENGDVSIEVRSEAVTP